MRRRDSFLSLLGSAFLGAFRPFRLDIWPVCVDLLPCRCECGVDEVDVVDEVDSFPVHGSWF